ncbi:MAG TPA: FAD-dependent oxidoreductase, partial [Acidimicrobiales bacterium]|nr:FAD-dependent oxidoreductase [Acidimicrobiales bacterium]
MPREREEEVATVKIVVVGGGAAGIGAAGAAKGTDKNAEVVVYTEYEDAAYSPCGIPYVHGKEISDFQSLFLASKESYKESGIDIHYETAVTGLDVGKRTVTVAGEGDVSWDRLILGTGFNYADPGVPGTDLDGLYYVKNIREAIEWDKVLDNTKVAVVVEASPLGLEMVTALAHRGIETHLVDHHPWALAEATDPDIAAPVEPTLRPADAPRLVLGRFLVHTTTRSAGNSPWSVRTARTLPAPSPTNASSLVLK